MQTIEFLDVMVEKTVEGGLVLALMNGEDTHGHRLCVGLLSCSQAAARKMCRDVGAMLDE